MEEEEEEMTDCNLELQLHPSSSTSSSASSPSLRSNDRCREKNRQQLPLEKIMLPGEEELLPLTIFYGGEICIVNVNRQQTGEINHATGGKRKRKRKSDQQKHNKCFRDSGFVFM